MTVAPATHPPLSAATPAAVGPRRRLAYLTTEYPKVSHTFIRRELMEIESRGHEVLRLAIREADAVLVDPLDREEQGKTLHCLSQPKGRLLGACLRQLITRPGASLRGLRLVFELSRRSDRGLVRHLAYWAEAAYLLGVVRRERIQHIHVHFGTNAAAVAMVMRRMGGPTYSMTVHGPDEFDAVMGLSLAAKVGDAAFVAAISDFCAAQIRRWTPPEAWGKVHVVRCAVGDSFFDAARPVDPSSKTLLCIGRLSAQKGHLVLLDAFARAVRAGVDARLVLAGDGEFRPRVEAEIARLGLGDRVEITGWIDEAEIRRRILQSRALVMASFAEGLPMVIMEAMALGRPAIATAIAGIPELVRPGVNGWLVTAGRADELAAAIGEAMKMDASGLDAFGAAGRATVRQRHNTGTEGGVLERLFMGASRVD